MICPDCVDKNKEIVGLKGQVSFYKKEGERWRSLFNERRGGEVFNDLQRRYADQNVENSKLRLQIKKLKEQVGHDREDD